ncbi:hypothetical protein RJ639_009398 [Escallonia herrerae]|uniref:Aminotransferase-like plant mobile domain-containing protein n=1 Tax=Escallonia herrerae TaxID=1293975 RepID=A0AA88VZI9_9ASTE|nr:hypothetical protein RJ639_009398 [Escallonia herrerae]
MVVSLEDTIMEERLELMVSPTGGEPTLRIAHFLKPSVTSIDGPISNLPLDAHSFEDTIAKPNICASKVAFKGWRNPQKQWKHWVHHMHSLHQSTLKEAGIHEAVMNSTFEIPRNDNLIFAFAEKWCCETRPFVFPWGEATITLEDMMVLGGYSVLGDSVSTSLKKRENEDDDNDVRVTSLAPLQLVQTWIWEIFPTLRPNPHLIENDAPRMAPWDKRKKVNSENVRQAINSATEHFFWRPYAMAANGSLPCKLYKEEVDGCLLVLANWRWVLYIPSRFFEADVTERYLDWWKRSIFGGHNVTKTAGEQKSSSEILKRTVLHISIEKKADNDLLVPPGFRPKCNMVEVSFDDNDEDKRRLAKLVRKIPTESEKSLSREHGKPSLDAQVQSPSSSSTADNGTVGKDKCHVKPVDNSIRRELAMEDSEKEAESGTFVHDSVSISKKAESGSLDTCEKPGLDLEARIEKLE